MIAAPAVVLIVSLGLGGYAISPSEIVDIFYRAAAGLAQNDEMAANLVLQVRLPRVLGAMLVGGALALAGAVFQGLFRNPLASPYTLGVSNGAGFGAAIAIILSGGALAVQSSALVFGVGAVALTFALSAKGRNTTVTLLLAGLLVGSLFASLVSLLKFVADPFEKLPQIVFWLMGSLSGMSYERIVSMLPLYVPAMVLLLALRWHINVLSMGDQEARSYGIDVGREKPLVIVACTVLTALAVSVAGVIGWVGVVVPHLARLMIGPDFRRLIPASLSLGMCYLMVIDDVCRAISAAEIPIGVVTGIIGTPLFIWFIYRGRVRW